MIDFCEFTAYYKRNQLTTSQRQCRKIKGGNNLENY